MTAPARTAKRLDQLLVERGLFATRSRASDAIRRGTVTVAGTAATKPGQTVEPDIAIAVADPAATYVSRAALKLVHGLEHFRFDPAGLTCLDLGASTGGFTQVLLERGARHVVAVDVGQGQMDARIAKDPRMRALEGVNARNLTLDDLGGIRPQAIVCDVSFISLKLALPPALELAEEDAWGVFLIKPQFEAGREAIGKGGILKDVQEGERIAASMADWLNAQPGWRALGIAPSPIEGGDGNREYLLGGVKDR